MTRWIVLALLLPSSALAQDSDVRFAGSQPPDSAAMALAVRYGRVMSGWSSVAERDSLRSGLVADGYFYQGIDGTPIDLEGMTARQTRNELRIDERSMYDLVFHQYENTALVTYKMWTRGEDKGHPIEGYASGVTVLTRTPDGWRVAADIIGQDPEPPSDPDSSGS
ncbi:MAG: nuclear transport factor 2 family protein [Gemmatimonadota bacterium]|nr:nuclear transport factor 2 family protein [Gemmatimonadota bacterium]